MLQLLAILVLAVGPLVRAATYPLKESHTGDDFFSGFRSDPSTFDNTTNGDVLWARISNSSIYSIRDGRAILKVDNTSFVPYNEKRYAPKILSKTAWPVGTVWVMDAIHMPYGCSVWPALWTQGPNWPAGGEIDIVEGSLGESELSDLMTINRINGQSGNQIAAHTSGQCTAVPGGNVTGEVTQSNCTVGSNGNSGCIFKDNNAASYGEAFASAGGGVFITELASDGIRVWFLTRSAVPSSLSASTDSIDTSTLGTPVAWYSNNGCDFDQNFSPQTLTLTITLCGDWAGTASLLEETCGALVGTNTCYTQYVIDDAEETYRNAYFEINYINVYSSGSATGESAGASSAPTRSTSPSGTGVQGGSQAASSSGRSAGYKRWEGPGARTIGALVLAVVGGFFAIA